LVLKGESIGYVRSALFEEYYYNSDGTVNENYETDIEDSVDTWMAIFNALAALCIIASFVGLAISANAF
jgi:hypothetical protein